MSPAIVVVMLVGAFVIALAASKLPEALFVSTLAVVGAVALTSIAVSAVRSSADQKEQLSDAAEQEAKLQAQLDAQYDHEVSAAHANARRQAIEEAAVRTSDTATVLAQIHDACKLAAADTSLANRHLRTAGVEFSESAFGPFWDALEAAAVAFERVNERSVTLGQLLPRYRRLLAGRQHNFPMPPIGADALPNVTDGLRTLRELLRKGQTNPTFATIWEHRQTRRVMASGFQNLAACLREIDGTLTASLQEVVRSIDDARRDAALQGASLSRTVSSIDVTSRELLDVERRHTEG